MSFTRLNGRDLRADVNTFVGESGKAKIELFKASYQARKVDDRIIQKYIGALNGMLAKYGNNLKSVEDDVKAMNKLDLDSKVDSCLQYDDVKDVVYAKYDYASVLQFTDGLIRGIDSNKMEENDDIEDYFDHTVSMAFKDLPTSTAALVEDINSLVYRPADKSEISHFNAVKGLKIYNENDRKELYKASCKVIDYICDQINKNSGLGINTDDAAVKVAFVNNVIEYITYSVTAFMYRTTIINLYALPFTVQTIHEPIAEMNESVQEVMNKISEKDIKVMKNADDAQLMDPKNIVQFYDTINEFAQIAGTEISLKKIDLTDDWDPFNFRKKDSDSASNIFNEKLIGNPLYEFILNKLERCRWNDVMNHAGELAEELDGLMHNKKQGLSDTLSAEQEMLPAFRDLWKDKTSEKELQKIIHDLGQVAITVLSCLQIVSSRVDNFRSDEADSDRPDKNNAVLSANAKTIKLIKELYREIAVIVLSRFREIEIILNKNRQQDIADGFAAVSIKVPGDFKDNEPEKEAMGDAVPDTSRMPVDLYGMPTYEACRMYSEYASYVLGNDEYYSEALDMSKIVDTLQAFLRGFYKKAIQAFDNVNLKKAVEWVEKNQGDLKTMKFTGTMEVLPYKSNISYPSISDFNNKLSNKFNLDLLKSSKAFDEFINSLYANNDATLAKIWTGDSKNSNAEIQNYVLFGVAPGANVQTKILNTSESIQTEMANTWISTVLASKAVRDSFVNAEKQSDNIVRNIKTKLSTISTNNTQNNANQNTDQNAATDNKDNNAQANANEEVSPQTALSKIQVAYTKIVFPSYMIFYKAITDQYNYIKQAYSMKAQ